MEAMEGRLEDLCLVKECRELEEAFGVKLTDSIISEDDRWGPVMKTMLRQKDRERHVARCKEKAPLIARIEKDSHTHYPYLRFSAEAQLSLKYFTLHRV